MKYCVVGAGVVGTATGVALLEQGHQIHFVDTNPDALNKTPLREGITRGHHVPPGFDGYFVTVSAPTKEGGYADDGFDSTNLLAATKSIGEAIKDTPKFPIVVFRCTQPPGTTRNTLIPLLVRESGKIVNNGFGVCYWPEYLRADNATLDALHPRQITYSSPKKHDNSGAYLLPLLLSFGSPFSWVELEAAEYQKYIHNVFNAIKISSFNWFRILGGQLGLSPGELDSIIRLTLRSAEGLWNPEYGTRDMGPFDGACLPKDTAMLRMFAKTAGVDNSLLVAVEQINKDIRRAADNTGLDDI